MQCKLQQLRSTIPVFWLNPMSAFHHLKRASLLALLSLSPRLLSLQSLLHTGQLGPSLLIQAAANCDVPKCASCEYSKAKKHPTATSTQSQVPSKQFAMKHDLLYPGQCVSMDHFKVTDRGWLYTSLGKTSPDMMYAGGCIFMDHATGFVHIEHLINFTMTETIQAKCPFEKKMLDMGIFAQAYQSDNGIFAAADFLEEINKGLQNITFSGVGGNHQNGIAEWGIQSILTKTHMLLIHAAIHWLDVSDTSLWPMAVDSALHNFNHMPRATDVFIGSSAENAISMISFQGHACMGMSLLCSRPNATGQTQPKWKPQSHCGIFVGFSPCHSSLVPLVLNSQTGKISPQFHVGFDDWFTSVALVGGDDAFNPTQW